MSSEKIILRQFTCFCLNYSKKEATVKLNKKFRLLLRRNVQKIQTIGLIFFIFRGHTSINNITNNFYTILEFKKNNNNNEGFSLVDLAWNAPYI